jgi:hypothetical protein
MTHEKDVRLNEEQLDFLSEQSKRNWNTWEYRWMQVSHGEYGKEVGYQRR